jgi:putative serine protease PepD
MRIPRTILAVAVASVLGGAAGTGIAVGIGDHTATRTTTTTTTAARSVTPAAERSSSALSARAIYRRASGSVAHVTAQGGAGSATGTGFVVSADGLIVTNQHVVAGASAITVKLGDGAAQPATLVGEDASTDLAVLRIDTHGRRLTPLKLADSSKVEIGDPTFAIGTPFGLDRTLTTGVVSALDRRIDAPDGRSIAGVLQTDAALNPGNSGGPLLDDQGEVIGVNSQIEAATSAGGSGIGFAVPSNTVQRVLTALQPSAT